MQWRQTLWHPNLSPTQTKDQLGVKKSTSPPTVLTTLFATCDDAEGKLTHFPPVYVYVELLANEQFEADC